MNDLRLPLPSGIRWSGPFIVSVVAVLLGGWVVLSEGLPAISSLLAPGADSGGVSAIDRALERHQDLMKTSRDRFTGRSLFVIPPPPPRKTPPTPPPPPPRLEPVEPPPPPPAKYSGAVPRGMVGSSVFFESITIRVGEEKNGIKVLGIEPPSNVRIEHMGGTYSVPVWTGTDWSKLGSPPVRGASNLIKDAPTALLALSPPEPAEVALAAEPAVEAEPAPPVVVVVASDPDEPDSDAPDAERQTTRAPSTEIPTPPAVRAAMPLPAYSEARAIAPAPTLGPSDQPPPPISASRIAVMTPAEVGAAISQVSRARRMPGLDQATQARLREEFVLLRTRQGTAP